LIRALARRCSTAFGLAQVDTLQWRDCTVALTPPWERLTVQDAFRRLAGKEVGEVLRAGNFEEILVTQIEPHLGRQRPVFLYDYPAELGSLARRSSQDPTVAERFELYIAGVEIANGFSELVDPVEQRERFVKELDKLQSVGKQGALPEKFLAELHLIGEAAGIALGIDRLCMMLMSCPDVRSAVPIFFEDL